MNGLTILKNTLLTLFKHPLRSILSTLGIVFGVAAVISMLSVGEGAKAEVMHIIEQLGKNNLIIRYSDPGKSKRKEYGRGLTVEDMHLLSVNFPKIEISASKKVPAVVYEQNSRVKVDVLAVTPSYQKIRKLDVCQGRFICDLDVLQKNLVCVLGSEAAKELGAEGTMDRHICINKKLFHVVGILHPREIQKKNVPISVEDYNRAIFIPFGSDNSISQKSAADYDGIEEMNIHQKDYDIFAFGRGLRGILMRRHHDIEDFHVIIPQELLQKEQQAKRTFSTILAAIAALSLIIGGIGIVNIMLAMVTERTQEIGLRRAIGANKKHILFQFLMEALVLTGIGTLIGLVIGIFVSLLLSFLAKWSVVITTWSLLISLGMSSVAGLLSGLYPAYVAANRDPVDALRQR